MKFRGCAESVMMPTFSMMMATASEAIKPVTWGAPRIGRKATRSINTPTPAPTTRTMRMEIRNGAPIAATLANIANAPMVTISP